MSGFKIGRGALVIGALLFTVCGTRGADLRVPSQYANIQDAIDAANPATHDVVIVEDQIPPYTGARNKNLNFGGKGGWHC